MCDLWLGPVVWILITYFPTGPQLWSAWFRVVKMGLMMEHHRSCYQWPIELWDIFFQKCLIAILYHISMDVCSLVSTLLGFPSRKNKRVTTFFEGWQKLTDFFFSFCWISRDWNRTLGIWRSQDETLKVAQNCVLDSVWPEMHAVSE